MTRLLATGLVLAATLAGSTAASANPYGTAASAMPEASSRQGWQSICRDRIITRRISETRQVTYQVPMCNMVFIGKRYFRDGHYYADPNFVAQIY